MVTYGRSIGVGLSRDKALIKGITQQYDEIFSQMNNRDNGSNGGSILGNPAATNTDTQAAMGTIHNRDANKLEFSRFGGEGVEH